MNCWKVLKCILYLDTLKVIRNIKKFITNCYSLTYDSLNYFFLIIISFRIKHITNQKQVIMSINYT